MAACRGPTAYRSSSTRMAGLGRDAVPDACDALVGDALVVGRAGPRRVCSSCRERARWRAPGSARARPSTDAPTSAPGDVPLALAGRRGVARAARATAPPGSISRPAPSSAPGPAPRPARDTATPSSSATRTTGSPTSSRSRACYVDGEALVREPSTASGYRRGASGSACTVDHARAQPRAGRDGRADPRQRAASPSPLAPAVSARDAARADGVRGVCAAARPDAVAAVRAAAGGRPACERRARGGRARRGRRADAPGLR